MKPASLFAIGALALAATVALSRRSVASVTAGLVHLTGKSGQRWLVIPTATLPYELAKITSGYSVYTVETDDPHTPVSVLRYVQLPSGPRTLSINSAASPTLVDTALSDFGLTRSLFAP